ncbi:MAG: nucleotide exchange factor GrpE [Patescibacteria group bacterium]
MTKKKKIENKNEIDLAQRMIELEDKLARALADYHNLLKRVEQRSQQWQNQTVARVVDKLLDVYEDLSRAENHLKDRGLTMAANQFWAALKSEGVEKIDCQGTDFDPQTMDCIQVVPGSKNKVVEVVTNGYRLTDSVIRPAKVKVGQGKN